MRSLIISIASLIMGYIAGNLEYKTLEEILDDLQRKGLGIFSVLKSFIGRTILDVEGFDSDEVKANFDALADVLRSKVEVISELPSIDEKIYFIEDEVAKFVEKVAKEYDNKKEEEK